MEDVKWCDVLNAGTVDLERNDNPVCPHCGHECLIDECEFWNLYQEGDHEEHCPSCGYEFKIVTHARYSFSTDEQEDAQ